MKKHFLTLSISLLITLFSQSVFAQTPDFSMQGWAATSGENGIAHTVNDDDGLSTTTGGNGAVQADITTVSTLAELQAWVATRTGSTSKPKKTPAILYIKGKIAPTDLTTAGKIGLSIKYGGNITIIGEGWERGEYGELQNISLSFRGYDNIIIRNIKMSEVFYPNDLITLDECQHIWIDHCEFSSKIGTGIGVDTYDGLIDVKNSSRNITISWCYMHDHMKCLLFGYSDDVTTDIDLQVTLHHNRMINTIGRNPSLRYGMVHYFNNYCEYSIPGGVNPKSDYGIASRDNAHVKAENSVWNGLTTPLATDKFSDATWPQGYICQTGNIITPASALIRIPAGQEGCDFWTPTILSYNYTMEDASTVKATVEQYAGVGKCIVVGCSQSSISDETQMNFSFEINSISKNEINLNATIAQNDKITIILTDLSGRRVSETECQCVAGQNKLSISTNLKQGLYLCSVKCNGQVITKKISLL